MNQDQNPLNQVNQDFSAGKAAQRANDEELLPCAWIKVGLPLAIAMWGLVIVLALLLVEATR